MLGFLFIAVTVKGFVDAETGMTVQPSFEIIGYTIARGKTLIVLYSKKAMTELFPLLATGRLRILGMKQHAGGTPQEYNGQRVAVLVHIEVGKS